MRQQSITTENYTISNRKQSPTTDIDHYKQGQNVYQYHTCRFVPNKEPKYIHVDVLTTKSKFGFNQSCCS